MTQHYVDSIGSYIGGVSDDIDIAEYSEGKSLAEGWVNLGDNPPPICADQIWLFPGWSESPSQLRKAESDWRAEQLAITARQLEAIEEDEDGYPPTDLLPGTRAKWRQYRGLVSNWVDGAEGYPDSTRRPAGPA